MVGLSKRLEKNAWRFSIGEAGRGMDSREYCTMTSLDYKYSRDEQRLYISVPALIKELEKEWSRINKLNLSFIGSANNPNYNFGLGCEHELMELHKALAKIEKGEKE